MFCSFPSFPISVNVAVQNYCLKKKEEWYLSGCRHG